MLPAMESEAKAGSSRSRFTGFNGIPVPHASNTEKKMKITNLIGTTALLALTSLPALAETTPPPIGMPMQQGQMKCGVMQGGQMPMQQGQMKCGVMQGGQMPMQQGQMKCGMMQGGQMPMQQGQMKCGMMQGGQMPMRQGQMKCGMMQVGGMGMVNPEIMKRKQAMMKKHMATMEQHMANIESMLRPKELVELQKQK